MSGSWCCGLKKHHPELQPATVDVPPTGLTGVRNLDRQRLRDSVAEPNL